MLHVRTGDHVVSKWQVIGILLVALGIVRLAADRDWHLVGPWGSGVAIAVGAVLVAAGTRWRRAA